MLGVKGDLWVKMGPKVLIGKIGRFFSTPRYCTIGVGGTMRDGRSEDFSGLPLSSDRLFERPSGPCLSTYPYVVIRQIRVRAI